MGLHIIAIPFGHEFDSHYKCIPLEESRPNLKNCEESWPNLDLLIELDANEKRSKAVAPWSLIIGWVKCMDGL